MKKETKIVTVCAGLLLLSATAAYGYWVDRLSVSCEMPVVHPVEIMILETEEAAGNQEEEANENAEYQPETAVESAITSGAEPEAAITSGAESESAMISGAEPEPAEGTETSDGGTLTDDGAESVGEEPARETAEPVGEEPASEIAEPVGEEPVSETAEPVGEEPASEIAVSVGEKPTDFSDIMENAEESGEGV